MRCLRCGYPKNAHCRADGSCMWASCPAFVDKWPEEPKDLQPPDGDVDPPPSVAVEAAAPIEAPKPDSKE